MTDQEIRFRFAGPDDTEAICALMAEVFPDSPKARPEILRWQYWDNPFGSTASAVAETDDGIVGHFMGFPIPGVVAGVRRTIAMSGDAATRPGARGQGVFTRLTSMAWREVMARNDAPLSVVFPNPLSKAACARGGMISVADLPAWIHVRDPGLLTRRARVPSTVARALVAAAFRPRRPRGLVTEVAASLPGDLDELCDQARRRVRWGVDPSPEWLRWRFTARPGPPYSSVTARRAGRLVALAVCAEDARGDDRFLLVLELLAADAEAGAAALIEATRAAVGCDAVALIGSPDTPAGRAEPDPVVAAAGRAGFRRLPRRLEPRPLHFGVIPGPDGPPDPVAVPWRLQWSLLDHL